MRIDIYVHGVEVRAATASRLLEAKAAGAAIVATRVNEVPEILGEGTLGRMVPVGKPASMADVLVAIGDGQGRAASPWGRVPPRRPAPDTA